MELSIHIIYTIQSNRLGQGIPIWIYFGCCEQSTVAIPILDSDIFSSNKKDQYVQGLHLLRGGQGVAAIRIMTLLH